MKKRDLENYIKALESDLKPLEDQYTKMEQFYDMKPIKWHSTKACENWEVKFSLLGDAISDIQLALNGLREYSNILSRKNRYTGK
jgi:hypothetical protein